MTKDSNKFQELVFGKKLLAKYSTDVKKIKSNAGNESELSVLRIWRTSADDSDTSMSSHSLMYYHNTTLHLARRQPVEVSCSYIFALAKVKITNV